MDGVWKRTMLLTSNTMKISVFPTSHRLVVSNVYMRIYDLIFRSIRQYAWYLFRACLSTNKCKVSCFCETFYRVLARVEKVKKWWLGLVKRLIRRFIHFQKFNYITAAHWAQHERELYY